MADSEEYGFPVYTVFDRLPDELFDGLPNEVEVNAPFLKALRQKRGLSQEEVAIEIGSNQKTVSKAESGNGKIKLSTVRELAFFYEERVTDLTKMPKPSQDSPIYRAMQLILDGLHTEIPIDCLSNVRYFVHNDWDNPEFNTLVRLTKQEENCLWYLLAQEGWVNFFSNGSVAFRERGVAECLQFIPAIEGILSSKIIMNINLERQHSLYEKAGIPIQPFDHTIFPNLKPAPELVRTLIDRIKVLTSLVNSNTDKFIEQLIEFDIEICQQDLFLKKMVIAGSTGYRFLLRTIRSHEGAGHLRKNATFNFKKMLVRLKFESITYLMHWREKNTALDVVNSWAALRPSITIAALWMAITEHTCEWFFKHTDFKQLLKDRDYVSQELFDYIEELRGKPI